jgi:acetyl-CoA decarbonylase/synthase complex subunit delta
MTALPILNHAGGEVWRQKEARVSEGSPAAWGDQEERSVIWEAVTASTVINAGCDIVVMTHPKAVDRVKATVDKLTGK